MQKTFSAMSLYAKLRDGRHRIEFPEDFFPTVTFCNNEPIIPTTRWKKLNALEGCYEWTIFCTKDFHIIENYLNGFSLFYPNWYMLRFRSIQNSLRDIMYDSIYDLSSENYSPININIETGQKATSPVQVIDETDNMRERFSLRNNHSVSTHENETIKRFIIPISLDIDSHPPFEAFLEDVRSGKIPLPKFFT